MVRTIVIAGICFMATVCFAQETYYDDIGHFSFRIPKGWEYIYEDELPSSHREQLKETYKARVLVLCMEAGADYLVPPYIVVTLEGYEKPKASGLVEQEMIPLDWEEHILSEFDLYTSIEKRIKQIQEAEGSLPQHWQDAEVVRTDVKYYKTANIARGTAELYKEDVGQILSAIVKLQGSYRVATLHGYGEGDDPTSFRKAIAMVESSFAYDDGYRFGQDMGEGELTAASGEEAQDKGKVEAALAGLFIYSVLYAVCLWIGMKYMKEQGSFAALVFIAFASSLAGLVPYVGIVLSIIVMFGLICKLLDVDLWPDAVLIVVVANSIVWLVGPVLLDFIMQNIGFP